MRRMLGIVLRLMLALALVFAGFRWITASEPVLHATSVSTEQLLSFDSKAEELPYAKLMLQHPEAGKAEESLQAVTILPKEYSAAADEAKVFHDEQDEAALRWENERGWVEWTFSVPKGGWYELHFDYKPLAGGSASVVRGVQIDGRFPFAESERIELERQWKDSKFPYDRNEIGQQIRPPQTELEGWSRKAAAVLSASAEPLLYRLEEGTHSLRLTGVRESVALREISFRPKEAIPDYENYKRLHPEGETQPGWYGVIEAEQFMRKSSLAIQTDFWSEPYISPDPKGRITYNVLGGQRWRLPGEWVEWELTVPNDGWYELDLKTFQNYRNGFEAYRMISIDGKTPFQELLHYAIPTDKEFKIGTLADGEGEPFRFYLEKGAHTLRMTVDSSLVQPVYLALKETLKQLAAFDRHIRLLTGNYSKSGFDANIDSTRTWDMLKLEPDVEKKMSGFITHLTDIRHYINGLNKKDSDLSEAIKGSEAILAKMLEDVNEIPNKINDFSTIQNNIGTWMATLTQQPLLMDYIVVRTPGTETNLKVASTLSRVPYSIADFGRSFYLDYDTRKHNRKEALTIWVQRGRDYVELLREMVDQDFTPRTGIEVNINLMTNPNMLILGNAAGDVPDIALGVGESTPADFAMRDAVQDLSGFPGFDQVLDRFIPGVSRTLSYDGGIYGLPEVQNFQMLFYRTDILEGLHLKAPDTWEDVFDILPTLQENGMTMNYPKSDFSTLFFQNGAEAYSPDGLKGTLSGDAGQQAFKRWTELYRKYNLPIDIPAFFQHFRDGDIPIGIADFNTYVQLLVAAPEITGHWKIAPLPGIKQADDEVARWSPQGISAAMIMKKSERKDDAWAFLEWWTSEEVQSQYAKDMESFYGIEFRWNTANTDAMQGLAWPSEDLAALREQARWAKNMPYVPGYYFLTREMEFAWNRTVMEGIPAQESLEQAQLSQQREMNRRQNNFGITAGDDLRIPQISQPYEWEEPQK
ncbi:extracellular solute-binding protein [Paenibacillus sp. LHD-38]|uniref:extracellular solute-binding protein n=1 Tax=Paenibacillus sp. LHD-38 TaxID=3072143 RepID=UPI00280E4224|nr:extracellular solute-binding protein [Paenibacillus sp. LHD-38]MDQ8734702.1 extracellular solute-binding protein [Paenibacillus sp. LHD-38]